LDEAFEVFGGLVVVDDGEGGDPVSGFDAVGFFPNAGDGHGGPFPDVDTVGHGLDEAAADGFKEIDFHFQGSDFVKPGEGAHGGEGTGDIDEAGDDPAVEEARDLEHFFTHRQFDQDPAPFDVADADPEPAEVGHLFDAFLDALQENLFGEGGHDYVSSIKPRLAGLK